jgi:hypothetical protein
VRDAAANAQLHGGGSTGRGRADRPGGGREGLLEGGDDRAHGGRCRRNGAGEELGFDARLGSGDLEEIGLDAEAVERNRERRSPVDDGVLAEEDRFRVRVSLRIVDRDDRLSLCRGAVGRAGFGQ